MNITENTEDNSSIPEKPQSVEADTSSDVSSKPRSARAMHKIVFAFVGLFTAMCVTAPTAMWRVSQMERFKGSYVKTEAWTESLSQHVPANKLTNPTK
jgi:hypothetical protein